MTQANQKIRRTAAGAGVKHWQIAEHMGVNEFTFSRMLRKELPPEKQEEILHIITELEREG